MKTIIGLGMALLGAAVGRADSVCAIKAGKILTMADRSSSNRTCEVINQGVILIEGSRLKALGTAAEVSIPKEAVVLDYSEFWVMPGIIDPHTHTGTEGGFNDSVYPLNPELCIGDCVDPEDHALRQALAGGVTTLHTMPGSGSNLGGFTVLIKPVGPGLPPFILRRVGAMKITQAFNPERRAGDLGRTRMGMAWMLRYLLAKGKAFADRPQSQAPHTREASPRPEWENLERVFRGEIPTIVHTCQAWGVMESIRIFHDEFHLPVIVTHTEGGGYKVASEAARRAGVSVDVGPRLLDFGWTEDWDGRMHGLAAEYERAGVTNLSINTDSVGYADWIAPEEELFFQAAISSRLGLNEMTALRALTINPARALGIADRVGSLEVGKDADLVIKRRSLLDPSDPVEVVFVNGQMAYRRTQPGRRQELPAGRDGSGLPHVYEAVDQP